MFFFIKSQTNLNTSQENLIQQNKKKIQKERGAHFGLEFGLLKDTQALPKKNKNFKKSEKNERIRSYGKRTKRSTKKGAKHARANEETAWID